MPELTISLTDEQLQLLRREANQQQLTPEQLVVRVLQEELRFPTGDRTWSLTEKALIALLETHEPETRTRAREQLVALGQSAIPSLEEALETAQGYRLVALAEILAVSGSPAAIRPLLIAYAKADTAHKPTLYHELRVLLGRYPQLPDDAWRAIQLSPLRTAPLVAQQLKTTLALPLGPKDGLDPLVFRQDSTSAEIACLTALLRWQRTGEVAKLAAGALHQIALAHPVPQLRQALPYLHRAWHIRFAHPELIQARKAIEDATASWKDLPILAESDTDESGRGLPVPVDNSP
jgi:hypothetical protein